jgi:hypothetical protein
VFLCKFSQCQQTAIQKKRVASREVLRGFAKRKCPEEQKKTRICGLLLLIDSTRSEAFYLSAAEGGGLGLYSARDIAAGFFLRENGLALLESHSASSPRSSVKKTPHRHRAGFEPQRAPSFKKRAKAPYIPEKPLGLNGDPSRCATFTLLVVLASSASGDQDFS